MVFCHKELKKNPIVKTGFARIVPHLPSFSTLPVGRLLCSRQACPSYTLYGRTYYSTEICVCQLLF